jgi:hypothetical protein
MNTTNNAALELALASLAVEADATPVAPVVGMAASYSVGSDRYPCTVVAVSPSGHRIVVRDVAVTAWTPFPDCRGVAFSDDGKGATRVFTRRKSGYYREPGCTWGSGLTLGKGWRAYQDPSF